MDIIFEKPGKEPLKEFIDEITLFCTLRFEIIR